MSRLAIDGGAPVRATPMPGWPAFDEDDVRAVRDVLRSGRVNYWTGEHGRSLEIEFAAAVGARHAVVVSNGTVALELALAAIGIGPGDEVIVPSATFIATAAAVVACGATPVVVDVDRASQCLTAATVEPAITARTVAVVVVHLAGHPADMTPLVALAARHGLRVVEDCAQAHGARYRQRPVGSIGDIAAWSFCQDKILTTAGEGGAVTTSDEELWRRCWERKDHGKSWSATREPAAQPGFRWLHDRFGTNARLTEAQAAIGRNQLRRLGAWTARRGANAAVLADALRDQPAARWSQPPVDVTHAYYKFYAHVRVERLAAGWTRDRVVAAVAAEGVPCLHGGCAEIQRERAFRERGLPQPSLPVAAELGRTSIMLLVHPTLGPADMADTADALVKVLTAATR